MLTKLKNEESVYLQQLFFSYGIERTIDYLSISNYIQNLKYIVSLLNHKIKNNDEDIQSALLFLYKLLCKTFILNKCNEFDTKTFKIIDREIIYCLKIRK